MGGGGGEGTPKILFLWMIPVQTPSPLPQIHPTVPLSPPPPPHHSRRHRPYLTALPPSPPNQSKRGRVVLVQVQDDAMRSCVQHQGGKYTHSDVASVRVSVVSRRSSHISRARRKKPRESRAAHLPILLRPRRDPPRINPLATAALVSV